MADTSTETEETTTEETTTETVATSQGFDVSAAGLLSSVNAAIATIAIGGQSYKIGSRQLTRADLKQLYDMRADLMAEIQAESSSGLIDDCYVALFSGRG